MRIMGYKIAKTKIKLSNLSKIPPCPGIILPKSFILYCRLIIEATRSPSIENTIPIKIITNKNENSKSFIIDRRKKEYRKE